jgi:hypothetical protein
MEKYYDEFNTLIRKIFVVFKELPSQKFKSKLHIQSMQSKMNDGMRATPAYAITIFGPHIWSARAQIDKDDWEWFIKKDYGPQLMTLSREHKFNYLDSTNTVMFMKDAFLITSTEKKKEILLLLKQMLQLYSQFALKCKSASSK